MVSVAFRLAGAEGVAVLQTPFDDAVHGVHRIGFDVVAQNEGLVVVLDTTRNVVEDAIRSTGLARVVRVDVPVVEGKASRSRLLRDAAHDTAAVPAADRVGSTAREPYHGGAVTGLLLDDLLHALVVGPERLGAAVDGAVVVGICVDRDGVARVVFFLDVVLVARVAVRDEERRLDAVLVKHTQQLVGVRRGTIIEGQVDDLAVVLDFVWNSGFFL